MVADTVRRGSAADGLQPLNLARHWRQVLTLIEVAFGEDLDVEARRALNSMRLPPLLAPLIGLLDSLAPPGEGMMPGFVWLEGGRVVGTASARRVQALNRGWLISNVAVHPDWQGRGIGRVLLEAAVDYAEDYGGRWVVLQVRGGNTVARRLYESVGFKKVGEMVRLHKTEIEKQAGVLRPAGLRPAGWSEGSALSRLARTLTRHDVLWADVLKRELYQTGPLSHLTARLKGQRRQWWVQEKRRSGGSIQWEGSGLEAAVGIEVDRRNPWHRLRLLIAPQAQDEQLAAKLIGFGLRQLADAPPLPVEIEHPRDDKATQAALVEAGFDQVYSLMHMRLDLE